MDDDALRRELSEELDHLANDLGVHSADVEALLDRRPELAPAWNDATNSLSFAVLPDVADLGELLKAVASLGERPETLSRRIDLLRTGLVHPAVEHVPALHGALCWGLARALSQLPYGDTAAVLEESIALHRKAAELLHDEKIRAGNDNDLAIALVKRRTGNPALSIAEAISIFERLIERDKSAGDTDGLLLRQMNLATALVQWPGPGVADVFGRAIDLMRAVVSALPAGSSAHADALVNLANALMGAPFADPQEQLDEAVAAYELACRIYGSDHGADRAGMVRLMLSRALLRRWGESRRAALGQVETLLDEVLAMYAPGFFTERWAEAQSLSAQVVAERPDLSPGERTERAIARLTVPCLSG